MNKWNLRVTAYNITSEVRRVVHDKVCLLIYS